MIIYRISSSTDNLLGKQRRRRADMWKTGENPLRKGLRHKTHPRALHTRWRVVNYYSLSVPYTCKLTFLFYCRHKNLVTLNIYRAVYAAVKRTKRFLEVYDIIYTVGGHLTYLYNDNMQDEKLKYFRETFIYICVCTYRIIYSLNFYLLFIRF